MCLKCPRDTSNEARAQWTKGREAACNSGSEIKKICTDSFVSPCKFILEKILRVYLEECPKQFSLASVQHCLYNKVQKFFIFKLLNYGRMLLERQITIKPFWNQHRRWDYVNWLEEWPNSQKRKSSDTSKTFQYRYLELQHRWKKTGEGMVRGLKT